jgi:hypothetical protein
MLLQMYPFSNVCGTFVASAYIDQSDKHISKAKLIRLPI